MGPVIAEDPSALERARTLILYWIEAKSGQFMRIDTPADCGLDEWLLGLGLSRVDTPVKMVRNARNSHATDPAVRQFGIINQAMY